MLVDGATYFSRLLETLRGLGPGDRVSVLAPNTSMHLEAHFGMPYGHVVLNSLDVLGGPATTTCCA